MSPFQPTADKARWRIIYDLLTPLGVGEVLTYQQMADALQMPVEDRHTIQMAMRRAAREFEVTHKHAVKSEANVGYRVVQAVEHIDLARSHQKRAGRQLQRGHSKVVNVDLNAIEPETRKAVQLLAQAFSMQMEMSRRLSTRQENLEKAVNSMTQRQERSDDELAELKERMARIEAMANRQE